MRSVFLETVTHHFADVTNSRVNPGLNNPLIGIVFEAFCGTAVIGATPLSFAKPHRVFPPGLIRSVHNIACARI